MKNEPIVKYDGYLIEEGNKFSIIAARTSSGSCPFWEGMVEWIRIAADPSISNKNPKKIEAFALSAFFKKFCEHGPWKNDTQIKPLYDGYFEFKVKETGLRVPFYYDDKNRSVVILTHFFQKKSQKTPKNELERMEQIKREFTELRKPKLRRIK
jgi:phage-related protein